MIEKNKFVTFFVSGASNQYRHANEKKLFHETG